MHLTEYIGMDVDFLEWGWNGNNKLFISFSNGKMLIFSVIDYNSFLRDLEMKKRRLSTFASYTHRHHL
jgi:hypothetical protein